MFLPARGLPPLETYRARRSGTTAVSIPTTRLSVTGDSIEAMQTREGRYSSHELWSRGPIKALKWLLIVGAPLHSEQRNGGVIPLQHGLAAYVAWRSLYPVP